MEQLHRYLLGLLWPATFPDSALKARLLVVSRYLYALLRDLADGELSLRAMSLVYTTMLAIAPLLAVCFSLAKGLGFHRDMEPLILNFLAPIGPDRAQEITANIIGFVDNVSGPGLATISIAVLLFTALSMAQKVEASFNFVWRVDRPRSLARRFREYLSVMLIGPVVMSLAMGLIATLSSTTLMSRLQQIQPLGSFISGLSALAPYALVIVAFSLMYVFVPNSKIRLKPALAGGLFAGIIWAASGNLFTNFVAGASRIEAIYSGFAIVIVAMFWMYLSWLILLLGTQLAFYIQNPDYLRLGQHTETLSNGLRERLALSAMLLVGKDFDQPDHGWRGESLAARIRVPRHQLEPILSALERSELLTSTAEQRLMPARDPRRISVVDILAAVRHPQRDAAATHISEWNTTVDMLAKEIESAIRTTLDVRSLADLVDADVALTAKNALSTDG